MFDVGSLPVRGDRAVLRPMRIDDARGYATGAADPLVGRFAHLPESGYTEASVVALIDGEIRRGWERGDLGVMAIADPCTDEFAGSLVLFGIEDRCAEIGFWLHPDHRGAGAAADALALAVEFAGRSGITRLIARTVPENRASQRVLERSGFTPGETVREVAPSGRKVELLHYAIEVDPVARYASRR